jgi:DNA polymerase-3 subunit alpha
MLARGETMGLFQLNGSGMTAFLKQLKPTTIHDINAMVALYRPGPMEMIPQYIERKHNPSLVTYLDPRMEKIVDRSYGVITYQDDVMMISIELAGYSWLEADMLRKAMGKKIPEVMAAEKDKLMEGLVKNGMGQGKAEELWKLIEPFAAYGFNKCLPASARIIDANSGVPTSIEQLLKRGKGLNVLSLADNKKVSVQCASTPFQNGIKDIYRVTTRSGRIISATANHPLLTFSGWVRLDALKTGDRLATPRFVPEAVRTTPLPVHEAAVLGYLIAEGNLCHPNGIYFYSKSEDEIQDFISAASQFPNAKMTIDRSKSATSVYVGRQDKTAKNSLFAYIESLELHGKKATQKSIPKNVFSTDNPSLALFLGKLWQGDGAISIKNHQVFYATSSRLLADDVQLLLQRFGIVSTIHTKRFRYRDGYKIGWTVVICHYDNLKVFSDYIGQHLIGKKKTDLAFLLNASILRTNNRGRGTTDTIPADVWPIIKEAMQKASLTPSMLSTKTGLSLRIFAKDIRKRGYTKAVIATIGQALDSKELIELAHSDIFWDEVTSIEKVGREMTYDLTVAKTHNFIADNIFVHNSHAASYGRVAYQTAYMKANFPVEYMSAVLTADSGDTEKISEIIHECERMGIEVLPPDINESFADFSVVPGTSTIRFGLETIKNFGAGITEVIVEERKKNGSFTSLQDFLTRIHDRNLNKKSIEALICAGAFDRFGDRGQLYGNVDNFLSYNREHVAGKETGQDSLFADLSSVSDLVLQPAGEITPMQKLIWEKDLLGVYVSGHPLDALKEEVDKRPRIAQVRVGYKGTTVVTTGLIESVRELLTKKGDKMAFIKLVDQTDAIELTAFPQTYADQKDILVPGTCVAIKGKLDFRNDEPSILIDRAKALTENS